MPDEFEIVYLGLEPVKKAAPCECGAACSGGRFDIHAAAMRKKHERKREEMKKAVTRLEPATQANGDGASNNPEGDAYAAILELADRIRNESVSDRRPNGMRDGEAVEAALRQRPDLAEAYRRQHALAAGGAAEAGGGRSRPAPGGPDEDPAATEPGGGRRGPNLDPGFGKSRDAAEQIQALAKARWEEGWGKTPAGCVPDVIKANPALAAEALMIPEVGVSKTAAALKAARLAKGLTQGELADAVGCARRTVNQAERGDVTMSGLVLKALCRELDLDVRTLGR